MKYLVLSGAILLTTFAQGQSIVERARKLYEEKKFAEAEKLLARIDNDDKDYAAAQYYLGRIAFDQKDYDDAADYFEEATDSNDKVADYFNWLGNTYGTIAQDANVIRQGFLAPKMKNAWEKAIALDPKNLDARFSLISYYTQAPSIMGGSLEKAKEMARQVIALSPAPGHRSVGNILVKEQKIAEAEKEYLEMVKADANFTPVLANFYMNQKKFDNAFAMIDEALKKNPQDMGSVYQLGKTSALSGSRLDQGEECLKKYLGYTPKPNEPSHAGANMRLAQIYEKKGNKAQAKKMYETALALDGTLKEAKEGLLRTSK